MVLVDLLGGGMLGIRRARLVEGVAALLGALLLLPLQFTQLWILKIGGYIPIDILRVIIAIILILGVVYRLFKVGQVY